MQVIHYLLLLRLSAIAVVGSPTSSSLEVRDIADHALDTEKGMSLADTAQHWAEHGQCHPSFIRVNDANIKESNFSRWYNSTMADMAKKHSDAYEKIGEAVLFAELAAGQPNFKCVLTNGICQPMPSCKEIVKFIKSEAGEPTSHWWGGLERDITTTELLNLARKTYFVFLSYNGITRYYNTIQNELSTVEINGIGEAMAIVRDFTKASDVEADILCMVIGKLYEFAFTWLKAQIAMAFGATNAPGSISTAINLYIDAGKAIGEGVAAAADIKANDKYMKTNDTHSGLRMVEKPTRGLCAAVGADKADEKFDRTTDMNKYIKEVFTNTRKGFEGSFGNLIRGNHSNAPGSLLGSYMSRPDVATAIDRLDHNSTGFEENLTQSTTESLISGSLASDKCYVKCVDDVEKEWTTVCSTKSSHNESRYCPEQAPYRGCQYQCWVLKPTLSHEKPLPGTDKLSAWNLTLPGFMKTTYENSLKHGNTYTAPSEYAGSDILSLEKDLIGDHAALTLPTCISETNVITDYEKSPLLGGMMWGRDQRFPCQCGDWKSSGTAAFMYQLGLAPGQRDYESGVADELLLSICPWYTNDYRPLDHFLNNCENSIHVPHEAGKDTYQRGRHKRCDEVKAAIKDLKPGQANWFFCSGKFKAAERVMDGENGHVMVKGQWKENHKTKCRAFMKEHKNEFEGVKYAHQVDW